MKLRYLAVVAFTVMTVIPMSRVAFAASKPFSCPTKPTRLATEDKIGGQPLDTLTLRMTITFCHDGNQVWLSQQIYCDLPVVVSNGSIRGTPRKVKCEPNAQEYYAKNDQIEPIYDVEENTSRGGLTYQLSVTIDASGRKVDQVANLWCEDPNVSDLCTNYIPPV